MRLRILWSLWLAVVVAAALVLAACSSGSGALPVASPTPTPRPTVILTQTPVPTATPAPTATPTPTPVPDLRGFRYPIEGACLPTSPNLLPNAPRPYRAGIHEGIDFYDGLSCAAVPRGTPVLAAKAGLVIRADWLYLPLTSDERDRLLSQTQRQGYSDAAALDLFRGRQVWIDHGGGVVTRYAHLFGIAEGVWPGVYVTAGQVIGFVGNSGTPEGVTDVNAENHLHFEIWVGGKYLGQGLPLAEVAALLQQAFSP